MLIDIGGVPGWVNSKTDFRILIYKNKKHMEIQNFNLEKFNKLVLLTKSLDNYEQEIDWKIDLLSLINDKSKDDIEDYSISQISLEIEKFSKDFEVLLVSEVELPKEVVINEIKYISYVDNFYISAIEFKKILPLFEKEDYIIELANIIWRKEVNNKKDKTFEDNKELFASNLTSNYIIPFVKLVTEEIKNYLQNNNLLND